MLTKFETACLQAQKAEGLYGAMFAATRVRDSQATDSRKAAGVTAPDTTRAPNRLIAPGEATAEAERRLGRPETTHERQLRETAEAQAAVTRQIKAMHAGVPSTSPAGASKR